MSDYTPTGAPADQTRGASATIRSEFQAVATAIATKADAAGETYSGTHDFTGATLIAPGKADVAGETYSGAHDFSGASGVTLPAATTIGNVSATELGYLDGVTSAIQPQLGTKSTKAGDTYSGTHDFSGATAVSVPDPIAVGHAVNKAYADALSMTAGNVPTGGVAGDLLVKASSTNYDADWGVLSFADLATGFSLTGGTTQKTLTVDEDLTVSAMSKALRVARTSNTELAASNKGNLIDVTSGTFTQTFASAATLGIGWWCYYRNSGTGDVTLDPSGAETIDLLASFVMYPNECRLLLSDGSALYSIVLCGYYKTFTSSGTFTKPPGYKAHEGLLWGGGASGGRNTATYDVGGGGGGGCTPFTLAASALGATETVTIAATSAGQATNGVGTSGGNSTFGALVTGYGGGAGGYSAGASFYGGSGGGVLGAGVTGAGAGSYVRGGLPSKLATTSTSLDGDFGGGGVVGLDAGNSAYGGGGGGAGGGLAGSALFGGGGGGGPSGGSSKFGGAGGVGRVSAGATDAGDGTAPGGGGGGVSAGTGISGDGARGELRIWGVL